MFEKKPLEYIKDISLVGDDMFKWDCKIKGPEHSPYAGGNFILRIEFPPQYPFKAPTLKFMTKIYHPSVKLDSGDVCVDVVGAWGPWWEHCSVSLGGSIAVGALVEALARGSVGTRGRGGVGGVGGGGIVGGTIVG